MKSAYSVYQHIVKQAGVLSRMYAVTNYPLNLSGIGGGVARAYDRTSGTLANVRDTVYGAFDPFESPRDRENSIAHSLGKELGNFFLPKVYDPDDLGPYEEYSNYLKDTEQGDMYLREASKLRRQARLIEKKRKREEKEREHASASRYF